MGSEKSTPKIINDFPVELFSVIIPFVKSSATLFSILRINREIRKKILNEFPHDVCQNVEFRVRGIGSLPIPSREIAQIVSNLSSWNKTIHDTFLQKFSNLKILHLYFPIDLTNDGFKHLKQLDSLCVMDRSKITSQIFDHLVVSKTLDISGIVMNGIPPAKSIKDVSTLVMNSGVMYKLVSQYQEFFLCFENLKHLDVSNLLGKIKNEDLWHLKTLESINISGCGAIDDELFRRIGLTLKSLVISRVTSVTKYGLSFTPQLEEFVMFNCPNITNYPFVEFGEKCLQNLKILNIGRRADGLLSPDPNEVEQVKKGTLLTNEIFTYLKNLEQLNMDNQVLMTDAIFEMIPKLKLLIMRGCNRITDSAFEKLKNLVFIDISLNSNLTKHSIYNLVESNKKLKKIACKSCKKISWVSIVSSFPKRDEYGHYTWKYKNVRITKMTMRGNSLVGFLEGIE